ncbi:MAG: GH92 family glycosyl hydrolase [Bacteroidales bacterium]|nr:GH92 family glycosyl hydrolase [Bacteroidales bacterium]
MKKNQFRAVLAAAILASALACSKDPVDYVDPTIGNISHLLVPTFPCVQLPNSMLRVYPKRADFTSEYLDGFPIVVTSHREVSPFTLSFTQGEVHDIIGVQYGNEHITPYSYDVDIFDGDCHVSFAPARQSAMYEVSFTPEAPATLVLHSQGGEVKWMDGHFAASQPLGNNTVVYLYLEPEKAPVGVEERGPGCSAVSFDCKRLRLRYGVSFISVEQAEKNLRREIQDYDLRALARKGRGIWNEELGKIRVSGGSEADMTVFYTSLYRNYERPVCISEDGRYFSAYDGKVHDDEGHPFYVDDWIWDTFRASHPLRSMINREVEEDILESYLRMAEQMGTEWMPTFPGITGDSRRMNCNHAIPAFADALAKGLDIDTLRAYRIARKGLTEKTLIPWRGCAATALDEFYWSNGYFPALSPGEQETVPEVDGWERRQPVCVTLGTSYDCWALSKLASAAGDKEGESYFMEKSFDYRNLFNPETLFFHPKDAAGNWIEPMDYSFCGDMGGRDYYDENNGWEFRWEVQHNVEDLINLFGGDERFVAELDRTFAEPLNRMKFEFYAKYPDHTGNVGQFSMANEPGMHVPFLYNHAGAAWKTQKRVRQMLRTWFRDDLMGVPGDEDGGGLCAFAVYSMMGFYPMAPGKPEYDICSPVFEKIRIRTSSGRTFTIRAEGASDPDRLYISSASLDGETLRKPLIGDDALMQGGTLDMTLGNKPSRNLFE